MWKFSMCMRPSTTTFRSSTRCQFLVAQYTSSLLQTRKNLHRLNGQASVSGTIIKHDSPFYSTAVSTPVKTSAKSLSTEDLNVLEQAGKLLLKGNFESCISVCTQYVQHHPSFTVLLATRGEAYHHLGKLTEAKADYESALRIDGKYATAWKRLGILFYDQGVTATEDGEKADLFQQSKEHLTQALKYDQHDAEAQCVLGLIFLEKKDPDAAVTEFQKATKLDPDFLPSYRYIARIAHQRSQWATAITFYTHFMKKFGAHYHSLIGQHSDMALYCDTALNRGICYLQYGDNESALVDFTAVIVVEGENVPGKEWAYHFRGRVYFNREEWSKVIDDNTEALKINPMVLNAYKDRALAFEMLDRTEKAEEDRKMYLSLKQRMAFEGRL